MPTNYVYNSLAVYFKKSSQNNSHKYRDKHYYLFLQPFTPTFTQHSSYTITIHILANT